MEEDTNNSVTFNNDSKSKLIQNNFKFQKLENTQELSEGTFVCQPKLEHEHPI